MIIEKLMMPYILASLHPIMHVTCLVTTLIMRMNYKTEWSDPSWWDFDSIPEELREKSLRAQWLCIITHATCLVLHISDTILRIYSMRGLHGANGDIFRYTYVCEVIILLKVMCYIVSVIYIQVVVIDIMRKFPDDHTNGNNHLISWMLYEVAIFYFNVFAQSFFLVFSRIKSFVTLRDRVQLSSRMRYKKDFLDYI